MRYLEVTVGDKIVKNSTLIDNILESNNLLWLIDSEIEDAKFEIKNNTIIWISGIFYSGNWKYGIFRDGVFYGTWENGIFEGGIFKGIWKSGINLLI